MKHLIILLDGTWNDQLDNTNVWRLKGMVAPRSRDGVEQKVYYHAGVGTRWYDRFRGGAFGQGLYENVQGAYQWLMENYDGDPDPDDDRNDDDKVFVFGFSRGAYTARSLGGMITKCGLLSPGAPLSLSQVYRLYKLGPQLRPLYRLQYLRRRGLNGEPDFNAEERLLLDYSSRILIKLMGVWDTVGALGIPIGFFTGINRRAYGFLHTNLANNVERCYQALAIDENRREYDAAVWTRFIPRDPSPPSPRPVAAGAKREPIVEQRWFPGAHANVGGGYPNNPLAQLSLNWMQNVAQQAGLEFRATVRLKGDERMAPVTDSYRQFIKGAYRFLRRRFYRSINRAAAARERGIVETVNETIDQSVAQKWRGDPKYRPENLLDWERRTGRRVADI